MNWRTSLSAALILMLATPAAPVTATSLQSRPQSPDVVHLLTEASKSNRWVHVITRDRRHWKGRIVETFGESFDMLIDDTGAIETLRFADVRAVKGAPTSALVKLAIAAGAVVGFLVIWGKVLIPRT